MSEDEKARKSLLMILHALRESKDFQEFKVKVLTGMMDLWKKEMT